MARTLSGQLTTEVGQALTRPLFLVEFGFPTPVRYSSREGVTWNALTWIAATMDVAEDSVTVLNENFTFGNAVLTNGTAGRTIKIWQLYGNGPTWAVGDAVALVDGQMGQATIGESVRVSFKPRPPQRTPRLFMLPPTFNVIPPAGTIIKTPEGTITLERK